MGLRFLSGDFDILEVGNQRLEIRVVRGWLHLVVEFWVVCWVAYNATPTLYIVHSIIYIQKPPLFCELLLV